MSILTVYCTSVVVVGGGGDIFQSILCEKKIKVCNPASPLPTAPFHQVCLGVCQYPFMLLVREKQCRGKFSFSRT